MYPLNCLLPDQLPQQDPARLPQVRHAHLGDRIRVWGRAEQDERVGAGQLPRRRAQAARVAPCRIPLRLVRAGVTRKKQCHMKTSTETVPADVRSWRMRESRRGANEGHMQTGPKTNCACLLA